MLLVGQLRAVRASLPQTTSRVLSVNELGSQAGDPYGEASCKDASLHVGKSVMKVFLTCVARSLGDCDGRVFIRSWC